MYTPSFEEFSPSILAKYLEGTASQGESAVVEAWFERLKANLDYLSGLSYDQQTQIQALTFKKIQAMIGIRSPDSGSDI